MPTVEFTLECPYLGIPEGFAVYQQELDRDGKPIKGGTAYWVGESKYLGTTAPADLCPDLPAEFRKGGKIVAQDKEGLYREIGKVHAIWSQVREYAKKFKGNFAAAASQHLAAVTPYVKACRDTQQVYSDAFNVYRMAEAKAIVEQGITNPTLTPEMDKLHEARAKAEDAFRAAEEELRNKYPNHKRVYDELVALSKKQGGFQL